LGSRSAARPTGEAGSGSASLPIQAEVRRRRPLHPTRLSPKSGVPPELADGDQDAELDRLLKLGARPADIGQTGEESWYVLSDPEGNEFCLLRARLDPV
jgi:Glyoxalase-like domain